MSSVSARVVAARGPPVDRPQNRVKPPVWSMGGLSTLPARSGDRVLRLDTNEHGPIPTAVAAAALQPVIDRFLEDPVVEAADGGCGPCLRRFVNTWSTNLSLRKFAITTSVLQSALDAAEADRPRAPSPPGKRRGGRGGRGGRPGKRR